MAIPRNGTLDKAVANLAFELLQAVTVVHMIHLSVQGPGSFAAHKAMNSFYDDIGELADDVIEQYQGQTGRILEYPTSYLYPSRKTPKDCVTYLRDLYSKVDDLQKQLPYSELVNVLDEVKSLIDSTLYKLTFLQ